MTEADNVVMATYVPVAMAEEVRRLARESNTTASRWIETAIKHRIILEGKWDNGLEHDRRYVRGPKTGSSLINNVTGEKSVAPQPSDCKANEVD